MLYSSDTLSVMKGKVQNVKPNCSPSVCEMFLNHRMRYMYNQRPYWNASATRGVVMIPASYNTGTVTTVTSSNVVTGTATAWPVGDIVNTTLANTITQPGSVTVTPASMTNITADTWLYVDATGPNPEIAFVIDVGPTSFTATFNYVHSAGTTLTCSSLTGRTLRLGYQVPNFLITAITSATTLIIQNPFGGVPLTDIGYTILKNLYNFAPDLKQLMSVVDPQQGIELGINYPQPKLNQEDPQRTVTDFPILVSPHSISPAGTQLFEIWPSPTNARQLYFEYYSQPRDLKAPGDRPPPYFDPSVMVMGATADALRTRVSKDDVYFDPNTAMVWEQRFEKGLEMLIFADGSLNNQQYTWDSGAEGYPSGANWNRNHSEDAWLGNF